MSGSKSLFKNRLAELNKLQDRLDYWPVVTQILSLKIEERVKALEFILSYLNSYPEITISKLERWSHGVGVKVGEPENFNFKAEMEFECSSCEEKTEISIWEMPLVRSERTELMCAPCYEEASDGYWGDEPYAESYRVEAQSKADLAYENYKERQAEEADRLGKMP